MSERGAFTRSCVVPAISDKTRGRSPKDQMAVSLARGCPCEVATDQQSGSAADPSSSAASQGTAEGGPRAVYLKYVAVSCDGLTV